MDWAVGITSAPRRLPTLSRCIDSVRRAGWEPTVFAEPETEIPGHVLFQQNTERLGAWHNWKRALLTLSQQGAESVLLIQDDVIFCRNARPLVESQLWPHQKVGCVSLYTSNRYSSRTPDLRGMHRIKLTSIWGALAFAFPTRLIPDLLQTETMRTWKADQGADAKNVDAAVGRALMELGLEVWFWFPSLAQHIGETSTVNSTGRAENRTAGDFPGEDIDAMQRSDLWGIEPKAQRSTPAVDTEGQPVPTGDDEYDRAVRKWHGYAKRISMGICQPLWAAIRERLTSDMRTLECGSGISTFLFDGYGHDHTALEQNRDQYRLVHQKTNADVQFCQLPFGWYQWKPEGPYDLLLIDGPQGSNERANILPELDKLVHKSTYIFVDDTHRRPEKLLAETIAGRLNRTVQYVTDVDREFAILDPGDAR